MRARDALYVANASVLLTHQIDAAYWHEWELFGLPGGAPFFVLTNVPMVFVVVWGAYALALNRTAGIVMSWALVASGLIAFGLHSFFLARGYSAFDAPVSLALLGATLVISVAQGAVLVRRSRGSDARSVRPAAAPAPR
jgi:hypothetical protein